MKNKVSLGFSEVDITPSTNVQTVGYGGLSEGVLHRLLAQISVWHSNEGICCLVAIDHIGFMREDASQLRDEIGEKLGIPREKVMLCFSHTHSAPNVSLEPEYFDFLHQQILSGVSEAEKTVVPVKAVWGLTDTDIGVNRRSASGAIDRRLGILKVTDAGTGQLMFMLLRVTAHANALNNHMITSDIFGVTRELLEERYNCKVMLTQGASGNINPKYYGSAEALDKTAAAVLEAVSPCIDRLEPHEIGELSMFSQAATFFADVPSLERAEAISKEAMLENGIDGANWLEEVSRLHNENIKQQSTEVELQYFKLDNGCLCGTAEEIMCELALDVVNECNDSLIFFGGYTNGCNGYLPSAEEYDRGGFEVLHSYLIFYLYHGRVMPLNRETADKLVKLASREWNKIK